MIIWDNYYFKLKRGESLYDFSPNKEEISRTFLIYSIRIDCWDSPSREATSTRVPYRVEKRYLSNCGSKLIDTIFNASVQHWELEMDQ